MGRERCDNGLMRNVGDRLREIRKVKGYPQEKVMFNTRIKISRHERGVANVTLTILSVLCKYYGVTLEEFFRGIDID